MAAPMREQSGAKRDVVGNVMAGLVPGVSAEGFLVPIPTDLVGNDAHD
jgi:hypothetical protein